MDGQDEGGAGGNFRVEGEVAVDFFGTESTDGEAETVAFCDVALRREGCEEGFALCFGDTGA